MKLATHALVDAIERAYLVDLPEREWLAGLLETVAPALDAGHGTVAYLYDAASRPLEVWNFVGDFPPTPRELFDVVTAADDEYVAQSYLVTPFGTASSAPGFHRQVTFGRRLHKYGIHDAIALNAFDRTGLGAWIGALLPEQRTVSGEDRASWERVSRHVAAALRLRRRLASPPPSERAPATEPDAILSTTGKLEHAVDGVAAERANLADAVRRLDRARGRLRKTDPPAAVEAWRVLVRGRWSLVDRFEEGGRRYILAYGNASPAGPSPESFTDREREIVDLAMLGHSPKLIAYELGLSPSTVRVHLANASRKLGVRTRAELVTRYRAWILAHSS
ncbi:MAG: LuxR C-terminal-related transcriptional regulator [Polyangiaceae bacterium]